MKLKKKLLTLAAGSAVLAAGLFSVHAFARPAYYVETDYYSDAAKTQYIGTSTIYCSGGYTLDGQTSSYSQVVATYRC